eukprot:TRINITY_DN3451_c0_g1_i1.p1 TRINITY_DN3451_c0_g1~~TRINITY_DN3451_c0_g1_i1.p1  ORF type:complete len:131 (+),score=11.24 TRINITY_DN3451_c0_g1_i1:175-567(+)
MHLMRLSLKILPACIGPVHLRGFSVRFQHVSVDELMYGQLIRLTNLRMFSSSYIVNTVQRTGVVSHAPSLVVLPRAVRDASSRPPSAQSRAMTTVLPEVAATCISQALLLISQSEGLPNYFCFEKCIKSS